MNDIVIVGGGPSGLAAAYEAVGHAAKITVFERLDRVGGLARTLDFCGCRFDIGPHRFFTRNKEIHDLFVTVLGEDLTTISRMTRIFYNNSYFRYPLTPLNALLGVGVFPSIDIFCSYLLARGQQTFKPGNIENFEDWVVAMFGRRLYETFFRTYTEKVWGIPCAQIGAEWASQRIKGLSLSSALINAVFKPKERSIKTLADEFLYPRLGAGQLYEKMAKLVTGTGSEIVTQAAVQKIRREQKRVVAVSVEHAGRPLDVGGRYFLVSAPLTEMVEMMEPPAPAAVRAACRALRYRNHIGVNLLVEGRPFPDNWIYVHTKEVSMARVSNYLNFSPMMSTSPDLSPMTIEYFAFPDDDTWCASDQELIERATRELAHTNIAKRKQIVSGFVVRSSKAYPVIQIGYDKHIKIIKEWLDQFENLLPIGRSGMFKYNNQDHAMATGLLAARTALGIHRYDPWLVNIDAEYHEGAPAHDRHGDQQELDSLPSQRSRRALRMRSFSGRTR